MGGWHAADIFPARSFPTIPYSCRSILLLEGAHREKGTGKGRMPLFSLAPMDQWGRIARPPGVDESWNRGVACARAVGRRAFVSLVREGRAGS